MHNFLVATIKKGRKGTNEVNFNDTFYLTSNIPQCYHFNMWAVEIINEIILYSCVHTKSVVIEVVGHGEPGHGETWTRQMHMPGERWLVSEDDKRVVWRESSKRESRESTRFGTWLVAVMAYGLVWAYLQSLLWAPEQEKLGVGGMFVLDKLRLRCPEDILWTKTSDRKRW